LDLGRFRSQSFLTPWKAQRFAWAELGVGFHYSIIRANVNLFPSSLYTTDTAMPQSAISARFCLAKSHTCAHFYSYVIHEASTGKTKKYAPLPLLHQKKTRSRWSAPHGARLGHQLVLKESENGLLRGPKLVTSSEVNRTRGVKGERCRDSPRVQGAETERNHHYINEGQLLSYR
jgi:hypothetical protein